MEQLKRKGAWGGAGGALSAAALICGGIMCLVIVMASAWNLFEQTTPVAFALLYLAAGLALTLGTAALCRLVPAKSEARFCVCLAAAVFALRWLMVLLAPTRPESDFAVLFSAARELAGGNNVMNGTPYFQWWAYQSGFVAWMAVWIRLFHADVFFFQMMNCLCGAVSAVLVYGLARRFASSRGARAAGMLYLLYPGSLLLTPVLTNQHLSEVLLLAGLYIASGGEGRLKDRLLRGLGAGALLALSDVIRPAAVVAVLGALAVLLLSMLRWRELGRDGVAAAAAGTLCLLAAYFAVTRGLSWLTAVSGLNQYGLTNQVPSWKFALGLNMDTGGAYSQADADLVFASPDPAAAEQAAWALLSERLAGSTLLSLPDLFSRKIDNMWGGFEPTLWTFTSGVTGAYAARGLGEALQWWLDKAVRLASGIYIGENLLIAAGCVRAAWRQERGRGTALLLTLTALAYFCAHLLIEIQSRYRTLLFAVCLPLAALGADWLAELFSAAGKRRKEPSDDRTV